MRKPLVSDELREVIEPLLPVEPPKPEGGRLRKRPAKLDADKAYDARHCRAECRERHVLPRIARRGIERKDKLGRHHWVAERELPG
jgi:hypothetical protein